MKYRFLYNDLKNHLSKKQISLIIGARQTGKTTIMNQLHSELMKNNEQSFLISLEDPLIKDLLNQHPEKLFEVIPPLTEKKKTFLFIDEIQYLNNPSNFLKYHYDKYNDKIKLIVSGSSSFYIDTKFKDSLAGRKRLFKLLTLSFEEFLMFKNREEFIPIINKGKLPYIYKTELNKLLNEYILFGGYPEVVKEQEIGDKRALLSEIANTYIKKDADEGNIHYIEKLYDLLQIVAEQTSSLFNFQSVGKHLRINNSTVERYVLLLRKSFHLTRVRPFYKNIGKEIRKMPKLFFNDLGLRNYFVNDFSPLILRDDKGILFENFIFRRFLDRNDELNIQYWRTQKMKEVDFIIEKKNAFETKYSAKQYKPGKYKEFVSKYPDIPLNLIHFENALEIELNQPLKYY